jgi:hypothetical protein
MSVEKQTENGPHAANQPELKKSAAALNKAHRVVTERAD